CELWADDVRVVLATALPVLRCRRRTRRRDRQSVTARELIFDDHIGETELDVRRERCDRREAGKIAVAVCGSLVVAKGGERLADQAGDGQHRDEGHETVFPGEVELRVHPLDLKYAGDVGIDVETRAGVGLAAPGIAPRLPGVVTGKSTVVRPHLAVAEIQFD